MEQYLDLLRKIKNKGIKKPAARSGMPGTLSLFGYQFRHDLSTGFPLLTTKKMHWKSIVTELLWFLRGDTNIKYLINNGCGIWNEDAYNFYLKQIGKKADGSYDIEPMSLETFIERVKDDRNYEKSRVESTNYKLGDCGFQYGKVWRDWAGFDTDPLNFNRKVDQIVNVINSIKNTPESRRHIVTAIDPAHDQELALYWCHAMFQFNCRPIADHIRVNMLDEKFPITPGQSWSDLYPEDEAALMHQVDEHNIPKYYLDCQLYQRSADVVLGVPFNIASYALLTHLIAEICGIIPGEFIHTFGDVHIYDNHMAAVEEQLTRTPTELPKLHLLERHRDHGSLPDHFEKYLNGRIDLPMFLDALTRYDFRLEGYNPQEKIEAKLSTGLN